MSNYNYYHEIAVKAAKEAGLYLLDQFSKNHSPTLKSRSDVGLPADTESEKIILKNIQSEFPSHNIYSEEIGLVENESNFTWYVDPLDGTNNYYVGIPYFAVSIALVENNETILGVVFNPVTKQLFTARKGGGAFLNGEKILMKDRLKSEYKVLSFIKGHSQNLNMDIDLLAQNIELSLINKFSRILKMWAPALDWCLLALGKVDALVSFYSEKEDMIAGLLIAEESGIEILNFGGTPHKPGNNRIVASNKGIINKLIKSLKPFS
ncbi:MAG: inositol monophosphatase [Bacteroidota bacterium]